MRALKAASIGAWACLLAASCAARATPGSAVAGGTTAASSAPSAADERAAVAQLVASEEQAIDWLVAADPRLATRLGAAAPESILSQIGMEAVLAEDASAAIHDGALDLFGFRARGLALDRAAKEGARVPSALPTEGAPGSAVARPALERELLVRLVDEERARAADEAKLGAASSDLVRGMLATWKTPAGEDAWRSRDAWAAKHLLDMADSLRSDQAPTGPLDLDDALYPLERLLAPLEFPKASAALARVRTALDNARAAQLWSASSVAQACRVHLGVAVDVGTLEARLAGARARLRASALAVLEGASERRPDVESRARALLFVESPCPPVVGSRLRAALPPPERAAICGLVRALAQDGAQGAAIVAIHDDVSLALAALDPAPPPRTDLLSHPDDDHVDAMRSLARRRPVVAVGMLVAAFLLFDEGADTGARVRAWTGLGEAPLDVVAREVGARLP
jgi:hypothetical protein